MTQETRSETDTDATAVSAFGHLRPGFLSYIFTRSEICGYIFILPFFIGFLVWTLGPFLISIYLSTVKWSLLGDPEFVGLGNYRTLFLEDERFRRSLLNTFIYVFTSVPLQQIIALTIAMLLAQELGAIYIYRTIFYLPAVTSGVATAILWTQIFGYQMGLLNAGLRYIGIPPQAWLTDVNLALPTLIFISLWNVGNTFIIYLAGLKGVPTHLYEAAEVDGATALQRFFRITIPMITPSIFFNVVMGLIGSFQVFTQALVMTGGGPADRTLFYVLYLYFRAFQDFRMGYAAAMAWILFLIIMFFTAIQLVLSNRWVYYETT